LKLIPPINEFHKYLIQTSPKSWNLHSPHILLLCKYLQDVADGKITRLAISQPPRSGKSETLCRFAAYMLEKRSNRNVLVCGYNQSISRRFSRKTRTILDERVGLSENHQSIDEWSIDNNSVYYVGSVNSPKTGIGFNLVICDDLIKNREEASSPVIIEKLRDFYREDLYSRLEPDGSMILVGTRWSENDPIAYAISLDSSFKVINVPALCEDEENDPLSRKIGESIFPERYSTEDYLAIKEVVGEFGFASLYQGRPIPKDGGLFNVKSLNYISEIPEIVRKVRSWDVASSDGKNDYSASTLLGVDKNGSYYILDCWRGQLGTKERDIKILDTAKIDGPEVKIVLPEDPGAAGKSMTVYWTKLLAGFNVRFERPIGNKTYRAEPLAVQINNGNVYVLRNDWNRDMIKEMETFPFSRNDDQIDSLSSGFNDLVLKNTRKFIAV
jgi:predicted phage terminase large subunit-like protein